MTTTEVLREVSGLTRDLLYFWERKGWVVPERIQKKKMAVRNYSDEQLELIGLIWQKYQEGLLPQRAFEAAVEEIDNPAQERGPVEIEMDDLVRRIRFVSAASGEAIVAEVGGYHVETIVRIIRVMLEEIIRVAPKDMKIESMINEAWIQALTKVIDEQLKELETNEDLIVIMEDSRKERRKKFLLDSYKPLKAAGAMEMIKKADEGITLMKSRRRKRAREELEEGIQKDVESKTTKTKLMKDSKKSLIS